MASAIARHEAHGSVIVNFGIGIPTLVANHLPHCIEVTLLSKNGMLRIGSFPYDDAVDPNLINAENKRSASSPKNRLFRQRCQPRDDPGWPCRFDGAGCDGGL